MRAREEWEGWCMPWRDWLSGDDVAGLNIVLAVPPPQSEMVQKVVAIRGLVPAGPMANLPTKVSFLRLLYPMSKPKKDQIGPSMPVH